MCSWLRRFTYRLATIHWNPSQKHGARAIFGIWTKYLASGTSHGTQAIFGIWTKYLASGTSRNCLQHFWFLIQNLPERFKNKARKLFFGLDRRSGFWNLQKIVLKHFWCASLNYCQNVSKAYRASYFWFRLAFGTFRKPFWSISGSWSNTIARKSKT